MKEWLKTNGDKLILLGLTMFFTGIALHMVHDMADKEDLAWITGLVSSAVGALLILITGAAAKAEKKDGDSSSASGGIK
jgi:uncharacterized membrane protein